MILEEGGLVDEPIMVEEVEQPEVDLVGREGVEIPGVPTQSDLLQFMREGWRCNNLGLPVY